LNSPVVSSIDIYPIKSTAGISLSHTWLDDSGLSFDRRFVVTDHQGQFITARTEPRLCLIKSCLTEEGLILTAPNMPALEIKYRSFTQHYQQVTVWNDEIQGQYCDLAYDLWLSDYLNKPCQLLYFGQQSQRQVKDSDKPVTFADGYPLLLIAQASLDDLNSRLSNFHVPMAQFRPNLVINNTKAFAEDNWQRIQIGAVEFEVSKPCSRCIFTTVNSLTAEKHAKQEPLTTLKSYRQVASGDVMFGQNLIPLNKGKISLSDEVIILEKKASPNFVLKNPAKAQKKSNLSQFSNAEQLSLRCVKIINETHDVKTFIFKNEADELIHYLAGQHLPINIEINGQKISRCYTLSSSPTRAGTLAITVKRVQDNGINGLVSNYLHDHFTVGSQLSARQPQGYFHLADIENKKLLFLSAGSGITPMLAMLREQTDTAANNDIVFFHSAHTENDLIAAEEVAALAKQHGICRVEYTLTRQVSPQWKDYQGRINQQMLSNIPQLTSRDVFVCGPEAFRDQTNLVLEQLGLPSNQFHFESFGERKAPAIKQTEKVKKVSILFDSWGTHHLGNSQDTVLEQGEEAGLIIPYSCRGGMCGSCKVKLESGEVEQLATDGLTDDEQKQDYILACSSIPKSDLVITRA